MRQIEPTNEVEGTVPSQWYLALKVERDQLRAVLDQIADPSYVGNYEDSAIVRIYREWSRNALERYE